MTKDTHHSERKEDRRRHPTPFFSRYTFTGKRHKTRRDEEQYNYYVDRIGNKGWMAVIMICALSIIDSLFTIALINRGLFEINPIMNTALFIGRPIFIISKYIFTILGITILVLHINFRFVKELITVIITFYVCLNLYHVWLFTHLG